MNGGFRELSRCDVTAEGNALGTISSLAVRGQLCGETMS